VGKCRGKDPLPPSQEGGPGPLVRKAKKKKTSLELMRGEGGGGGRATWRQGKDNLGRVRKGGAGKPPRGGRCCGGEGAVGEISSLRSGGGAKKGRGVSPLRIRGRGGNMFAVGKKERVG